MTRETKIGLVVGLGFIVVFAILLSHKGTANHVGPPSDVWPRSGDLQLVDAGSITGDATAPAEPDGTAGLEGAPAAEGFEVVSDEAVRAEADAAPTPAGSTADDPGIAPPAVASELVDHDLDGNRSRPNETTPDVAPEPAPVTAEPETPSTPTRQKDKPDKDPEDASSEEVRPVPPAEHHVRKHVVEEGDTLYGLARRYHNTPATKVIDAIFHANKEQLPSPDALKPGQILSIPMDLFEPVANPLARPPTPTRAGHKPAAENRVRSAEPDPEAVPTVADAKSEPKDGKTRQDQERGDGASASASADWQWYVIKQGDTLYSVAGKVLGTSTRWREIQALNKSSVPDPKKLRPGDKIKVPVGRPPGLETAGLELPR